MEPNVRNLQLNFTGTAEESGYSLAGACGQTVPFISYDDDESDFWDDGDDNFEEPDYETSLAGVVLEVAKRLMETLESEQQNMEEQAQVGEVFLQFASELCQVYKTYCSTYSVEVLPLLKKYESCEAATEELGRLAQELHLKRPHLLTLNTALIKPVQRILKYPLYLSKLMESTESSHPDYCNLHKALVCLEEASRDVNEYTRSLNLVYKYRGDVDHSLHAKMRRVSLHSIAKKSARMSTIFSQKLGIISKTSSTEFDEVVVHFRSIERAAEVLVTEVTSLLEAVRARHTEEMLLSEGLVDLLPNVRHVQAIQEATLDSCNRALRMFDYEIQERVLQPATQVVTLCGAPARLIHKRHHKKLDYDAAQARVQLTSDTNIANAENDDEDVQAIREYQSLHTLLMEELPILTQHATKILTLATRSLAASRLYLQGHLAKLYLTLAQDPLLGYISLKEAQERAKQQVEQLRLLLPHDYQKKHTKEHRTGKTLDVTKVKAKARLSLLDVRGKELLQARTSAPAPHSSYQFVPSRGRKSYPANTLHRETDKGNKRSSLPVDYLRNVTIGLRGPQHTTWYTPVKGTSEFKNARDIINSYPVDSLYLVKEAHTATQDNEITLQPLQVVALLKKADPSGGTTRWVIDDGENVGLVRPSCLRPLETPNEWNETNTAAPLNILPTAASRKSQHLQGRQGLHPESQFKNSPSIRSPVSGSQLQVLSPVSGSQSQVLNPVSGSKSQVLSPVSGSQSQVLSPVSGSKSQVLNPVSGSKSQVLNPVSGSKSQVLSPVSGSKSQVLNPVSGSQSQVLSPVSGSQSQVLSPVSGSQSQVLSPVSGSQSQVLSPVSGSQSQELFSHSPASHPQFSQTTTNPSHHYPHTPRSPGSRSLSIARRATSSDNSDIGDDDDTDKTTGNNICDEQQIGEYSAYNDQEYVVLYNFEGSDEKQLDLHRGQLVQAICRESPDWWYVEDAHGNQGYVPATYLHKSEGS
ncbi:rho guanine nucleotide exchange factor 38-like isoform X2 [Cherax quadricarinatus]|uniref:rho guanine nucleotide exchange factor 38-like isoform X2 n=1 Tax=Cherax quadricarinatus TaxID=27406 RepID=UPI00387ED61F